MFIRNLPQPEGTPTWIALNTPDTTKARKFYEDLFDWEFEDPLPGHHDFILAKKNSYYVAGIVLDKSPAVSPGWLTYLATNDMDKTINKLRSNNGQILKEPIVPNMEARAVTAIAKDPGGAEFGLWEAKSLIGMGAWEDDGVLMWSEQFSAETEKCRQFYKAVFENIKYNTPVSWHFGNPLKEVSGYTMFSTNGEDVGPYGQNSVASIGTLDAEDPVKAPHWMCCFATIDIHATVNAVQKLGGTVLLEPYNTMFGPLAIVTDNQGAAFMLAVKPDRGAM